MKKSRELYVKLVAIKCNTIEFADMSPDLYRMCTQLDISVEDAFRNQLCSNIEIKLREFNFKVMHGILSCNSNLKKKEIKKKTIYVIFVIQSIALNIYPLSATGQQSCGILLKMLTRSQCVLTIFCVDLKIMI